MFQKDLEAEWNFDLEHHLRESAFNETSPSDMFVFDELVYLRDVPASWEEIVIRASMWEDLKDPARFYTLCAEFLVKHQSSWDGLSDLLAKQLRSRPSYNSLTVVTLFVRRNKGQMSKKLADEIRAARLSLPLWKRAIFRLDGPITTLFRQCESRGRSDTK